MRFTGAEETPAHRQIVRKIQIGGADTAGQSSAERSLQTAGPKGQERFGVREKEPRGNLILPSAEFTVIVGSELIVGIFARTADQERARYSTPPRKYPDSP